MGRLGRAGRRRGQVVRLDVGVLPRLRAGRRDHRDQRAPVVVPQPDGHQAVGGLVQAQIPLNRAVGRIERQVQHHHLAHLAALDVEQAQQQAGRDGPQHHRAEGPPTDVLLVLVPQKQPQPRAGHGGVDQAQQQHQRDQQAAAALGIQVGPQVFRQIAFLEARRPAGVEDLEAHQPGQRLRVGPALRRQAGICQGQAQDRHAAGAEGPAAQQRGLEGVVVRQDGRAGKRLHLDDHRGGGHAGLPAGQKGGQRGDVLGSQAGLFDLARQQLGQRVARAAQFLGVGPEAQHELPAPANPLHQRRLLGGVQVLGAGVVPVQLVEHVQPLPDHRQPPQRDRQHLHRLQAAPGRTGVYALPGDQLEAGDGRPQHSDDAAGSDLPRPGDGHPQVARIDDLALAVHQRDQHPAGQHGVGLGAHQDHVPVRLPAGQAQRGRPADLVAVIVALDRLQPAAKVRAGPIGQLDEHRGHVPGTVKTLVADLEVLDPHRKGGTAPPDRSPGSGSSTEISEAKTSYYTDVPE